MMIEVNDKALECRARRAATRAGYVARKSRWYAGSGDNHGGFIVLDASTNFVVAGARYDMSAEEVLEFLAD